MMGAPGADGPERPLRPVPLVVVAPSECPALTVPAQRNLSLNDPVLLTHDGRALTAANSGWRVVHNETNR